MDGTRLLIGDLAEQAGLAISAIRFYEAAGLLQADGRTDAGYRVYEWHAVHRLRFIQRAKALGMTLAEIKRLIESPRGSREDERSFFDRFIATKIDETQSRIAALRTKARQLRGLEAMLDAQPPAGLCHLGDCACWLPA